MEITLKSLQPMVIATKIAGPCYTCGQHVPADGENRGYAVNDGSGWKRYCRRCVPVRVKNVRRLTRDGYVEIVPFDKDALPLLRSIPGARFEKQRTPVAWKVSLADGDRARLLEVADQLGLEVPDELTQVAVSKQAKAAHHAGLYPFQVEGVDWLAKGDKRLLCDEMGLGKTVQSLAALADDSAVLIVTPATIKDNWRQEAEKWVPQLKATVLKGRSSFRLPKPGELVIVNFDILPEYLEPEKKWAGAKPWEVEVKWPSQEMAAAAAKMVVVVDEAHKVKNYKTARAKRVKGLCLSARKVWALTGTPLENRPADLFGMLESLQMQHIVFGGWKRFVELMGGYRNRWGGYDWGTPQPIVPELMRRVMLRRKRHEVLPDLPAKTYTILKVPVPVELREYMDKLWDEWSDLLDAERMEDRVLPPFEEFSSLRQKLAESRTEGILELAEEHEEEEVPLVIFSAHLAPLNALAERPGWAKITGDTPSHKRQEIVNRFQAGELKGVACSIRAAGIGLTLTRAWKMIFVDLDWVPGQNQQAEDRICRIGQTANKVEIVRMVSDHVLDQHILDLIAWKISIIDAAVDNRIAAAAVPTAASETEEEFEDRMAEAQAPAQAPDQDGWPAIVPDKDIPF